jgi:16S rRNA (adenine1518-N6/adenine1519-N6)-dimethyltransferase
MNEMMKLTSPSTIKYIMEKHGFKFSKSLGQNFLINEHVVDKILDGAEVGEDDCIIEVGTGIGVMTRSLADRAKKVVAIEIDKSLKPVLAETLYGLDNVKVIFEDVLKTDMKKIIEEEFGGVKPKVVANLPYYVTTPIIMMFLEKYACVSDVVVMVQKEVALRMMAKEGGKDYGTLTIAVQFYSDPSIVTMVPSTCFMPKPNVDSAVIRLKAKEPEFDPDVVGENFELYSKEGFFRVVKASFSKRRKTIVNSILGELPLSKEEISGCLSAAGIDEKRRGETLTISEYALLSNEVHKALNA